MAFLVCIVELCFQWGRGGGLCPFGAQSATRGSRNSFEAVSSEYLRARRVKYESMRVGECGCGFAESQKCAALHNSDRMRT